MKTYRQTICVDFDGVLHSYTSKFTAPGEIHDPPVPNALGWLEDMLDSRLNGGGYKYVVCIYSSRSVDPKGIVAMKSWLQEHGMPPSYIERIEFPTQKPVVWLTIDDRAICFRGTFPSELEIDSFKAWNK